ncbi:MAG TPA: hypothetical protein VJU81_23755 [Methylomirabilota bacterium]|nr:hypothetical protein [Methylomirabilota bacterium]
MRQLLRLIALLLAARALHRVLFGGVPGPDIPPVIDEVEALERRIGTVLPRTWTIERRPRRIDGAPGPPSRPYLDDWDRAWVLSTPWPGQAPQRAQIVLHLLRDGGSVGPHQEVLSPWERFTVVAQDPSVVSIGGDAFSWATLPGWPSARADLRAALGQTTA